MSATTRFLLGTPRMYGGMSLCDGRHLMTLQVEGLSNPLLSDEQVTEEAQNSIPGFAGTQIWKYTIEGGFPWTREVAGVLVPNDDVGIRMTDDAHELKSKVLQSTDAANLINYRPATAIAPATIQPLQKWAILRRLYELYSLPKENRWTNADWPTDEAFEDAFKFVNRLPISLTELPYISLANDGEVNFALTGGDIHLDLGFYGTGTYSYFARDYDGVEWFEDDLSVAEPLPERLFTLLSR